MHRSRRIQPDEPEDLERIARYIIRNPFSTEKMEFKPPNAVNRDGTVIYRSGMNPKVHRNFQIFTPCDFIAAITQHIPVFIQPKTASHPRSPGPGRAPDPGERGQAVSP